MTAHRSEQRTMEHSLWKSINPQETAESATLILRTSVLLSVNNLLFWFNEKCSDLLMTSFFLKACSCFLNYFFMKKVDVVYFHKYLKTLLCFHQRDINNIHSIWKEKAAYIFYLQSNDKRSVWKLTPFFYCYTRLFYLEKSL